MDASVLQAERIEIADDLWAANAFFEEKGWTDGLPIIPPTEERVEQMLVGVTGNPQDVVGTVPPRWAPATIEKIAINAVMAGCLPEYMPVLIAAVEAITDPKLNLYSLQATTGGPAIMLIINGPMRNRLKFNSGP
ncbi:MAG TPA: TlpA family protein disulfide reductase, partial [Candidatus Binatia bacterium]|nr:TlpA family protein disulfide reductase [Candidatus Binatia bacterium]